MNTEEDEFRRIEAEAKRRAARLKEIMYWVTMDDDDDTQVYTSDVALAEAYRCGYEAGAVAEREACAEVCKKHADVYENLEQNPTAQSAWAACIDNRDAIRARGTT